MIRGEELLTTTREVIKNQLKIQKHGLIFDAAFFLIHHCMSIAPTFCYKIHQRCLVIQHKLFVFKNIDLKP